MLRIVISVVQPSPLLSDGRRGKNRHLTSSSHVFWCFVPFWVVFAQDNFFATFPPLSSVPFTVSAAAKRSSWLPAPPRKC